MIKKSKALYICALGILILLLSACGKQKAFTPDVTCNEILTVAKTAAKNEPENFTLYSETEQQLDAFTMSLWADGTYEECEEFGLLEDYAILYSSDNTTYEIAILKAKNAEDTAKLEDVLKRRKETLSVGDKAEYDPNFKTLLNDSRIIIEDKYAILLITENNDSATKAIENLKQ